MAGPVRRFLGGDQRDIENVEVEYSPEVRRAFDETRVALAQAFGVECLTHIQMAGNNYLGAMRALTAMQGDELTYRFNAQAQAEYNIIMQRIKMRMFIPVDPQPRRKR